MYKLRRLDIQKVIKRSSTLGRRPSRTVPAHPPHRLSHKDADAVAQQGLIFGRTKTDEFFTDPKDVVFYEVALSKEGSYLVTGNTKHFPVTPIVVTPAELLKIINEE